MRFSKRWLAKIGIGSAALVALTGLQGWPQVPPDLMVVRQEAKSRYRSGQYTEAARLYQQVATLGANDIEAVKEAMWGFWNMGQYDQAADIARQVLKMRPRDVEAKNIQSWAPRQGDKKAESDLRREAIEHYQARRYEESARLYRELAQMEPKNIAILKEFMWSLWYAGRYDEAARVAQRVNELRPAETEAKDVLERAPVQITRRRLAELEEQAKSYADAGKRQQALGLYRRLVVLDPENLPTLRTIIWALAKEHDYEEAKTYAFQLMNIRPKEPEGWNVLAKMQTALEQPDAAMKSYQQSLAINPDQPAVLLALGKYESFLRLFNESIGHLELASKLKPSMREPYPLLGKDYYSTFQFAKARDAWTKAVERYPEEAEFRFNKAQAEYYAGEPDKAIEEMRELYATAQNAHAGDFVVDDLISRGDVGEAEAILESRLKNMTVKDESAVMKLASLYQSDGRNTRLQLLLNRFLKVWPDHQPSLLMKASSLYETDKFVEAKKVYERYARVNPFAIGAWSGLGACEEALGNHDASIRAIDELRLLDSTDPYVILLYAQALYESDRKTKAKKILTNWLKANHDSPVLPVLLYHGLSPHERDPVLAYPYHFGVWVFEDQMRAIHEAGYTPVSAEDINDWLAGDKKLPPRPIMIAFDDNRRDSFYYADPILEKYHLKATMFVAITNVEYHRPPAYVSWEELQHYRDTGRWEFESHGDIAHIHIPVNPEGGEALFLMNRQWLPDENRYETLDEWKTRIAADHESSLNKMSRNLGHTPTAYAWPEGLFGQQGNTNSSETSPINLSLVRQYFKAAYTQDHYGLNVRSRDPAHLSRIIPTNTWRGKDLIQHFTDRNPYTAIRLQLLEWAQSEGRTREAMGWLDDMKKSGVSEQLAMAKESEIRFSAGDLAAGQALATRLSMMESSPDVQKSIKEYEARQGPAWTPSFTYHTDNRRRIGREELQTLEIPTLHNVTWRLAQFWSHYSEPGVPSITNNGVGAGLDAKLGLFHTLSLDAMGHFLPDMSNTTMTGEARLRSTWTDAFTTQASAGRSLYDTASALNANVAVKYAQVMGRWADHGWDLIGRGYASNLTDDNKRQLAQGTIGRAINPEASLKLVARFTYDDMKRISPNYYSPQSLHLYEFGPEYSKNWSKHMYFYVRYLPGYGKERNAKSQLVHDVETNLRFRFTESTSLTPGFAYQTTPTYNQNIYTLEFRHVF